MRSWWIGARDWASDMALRHQSCRAPSRQQGMSMANWLERAKVEISKSAGRDTANTAERTLTAVTAVGKLRNAEGPSCFNCAAVMTITMDINGRALWECSRCDVERENPPTDICEGRIIAVLI